MAINLDSINTAAGKILHPAASFPASGKRRAEAEESSTGNSSSTSSAGATPQDQLATKDTFLKLLVAQIKNQDPLNPTDGVQFLSQLAQFSELEQVMGIRADLESLTKQLPDTAGQDKGTTGAAPAKS